MNCPLCGKEFFDGVHRYDPKAAPGGLDILVCPEAPRESFALVNLKYLKRVPA